MKRASSCTCPDFFLVEEHDLIASIILTKSGAHIAVCMVGVLGCGGGGG